MLKYRIHRSIVYADSGQTIDHVLANGLMHVIAFPIRRTSGRSCKYVSQRAIGSPVPGSLNLVPGKLLNIRE